MIIQEHDGGWLLFRQTDHALLSAAYARAWGNDLFPSLERRAELLVAAARHDDGWADWELSPTLRPNGEPVDFIAIPVSEHVPLYRRGIDLVEAEDPYAGLVASMHGERLYTRPFHPGMEPRIDHLHGRDRELADAYVDAERARQERLLDSSRAERHVAEEAWRLLQVWDRLSLLVCMSPLTEGTKQTMPAVATASGDVRIEAFGEGGDLVCYPYPFADDPVRFEVAGVRTSCRTWGSQAAYRDDFRSAERVVLSFRCRSVSSPRS
jgi:hypothetical protein